MPIYEYECQACHKIFEKLQSLSQPAPERCELCGQGPVKKLISLSGFVLKGSGFYTTDYPSASRKTGAQAETTTPAPAATSNPKDTASATPANKTQA